MIPALRRFASMLRNVFIAALAIFWVSSGAPAFQVTARAAQTGGDFYESRVQPILSEHCYQCHSHQADKIKGNFLLDSREALLKGGDTGPAIVSGDPEKSLLIKAVRHLDEDLQMPPKKKLPEEQVAILAEWIRMGAPYSDTKRNTVTRARSRKITAEDKKWWAFQPVRATEPPKVQEKNWTRNPIDQFILARLDKSGLKPAPEADKATLIRRVYFDLIGLPPTAEQVERFQQDNSPQAYEKVVDELLSNPHYGEKWARHWLDLVRYAESDGYKADGFRPHAFRYRDYVIRSLNDDKPYNRFLMEQIAADELWPNDPDALIGVSFLRLWIYEYNQRNIKSHWATILNDITDVTGDALLGLGMQCARCHDHKFDPILQKDYYRLQAFFSNLSPREDIPLATSQQLAEYRAQLAKWETASAEIRKQIDAIELPAREKIAKGVLDKFPKDIQTMMYKPPQERTPYEQQLYDLAWRQVADEGEKLDSKIKGAEKEKFEALQRELAHFDDIKPKPLPMAMLVTDIGPVASPLVIPKDKSQTAIEPGFLTLLDETPAKITSIADNPKTTGRRTALAKWMADPANPLTTRVLVNRLWQHHFGRGLVGTSSDFGHLGELPSHPELLDWLAHYFVEHDWSAKAIHRLIVTSAAYRQSANVSNDAADRASLIDPENRLLWRQTVRRLESDQIRDAMLAASGELDLQMSGASVETSKPRRTIYVKWLRNSRDPLLDAFDPPDPYTSSPQRNVTTTPMQSLVLLNGPYVLQRAQAMANRIKKTPEQELSESISAAYQFAYGRQPKAEERKKAESFLREQARLIAKTQFKLSQVVVQPMSGHAGNAAVFKPDTRQIRLQVPDNHLMPQYDFTVEAFIVLNSVDKKAMRTIVSRWDGRQNQPGWSFGVSAKSTDAPVLVLELIGDPAEDGVGGYETIRSGLTIELNQPYYVAATVRLGDTSDTGLTFYSKKLNNTGELRTAHTSHTVTANHQSNLPLILGAREPDKNLIWDGLIDDVRLSNHALKQEDLLLQRDAILDSTVGYWRFEEPDALKDSSQNAHNIRAEVSPSAQSDPGMAALVDLCHILLNSNEFLYVE